MVVVLILSITIIIVTVIIMLVKNHRGEYSTQKRLVVSYRHSDSDTEILGSTNMILSQVSGECIS